MYRLFLIVAVGIAANASAQEARTREELIDIIDAQHERLNAQQAELDSHRKTLQELKRELQRLDEKDRQSGLASSGIPADESQQAPASQIVFDEPQSPDDPFLHKYKLARFPTDVRRDRGLFIESQDGAKRLRLYGSVRMRTVYENRNNFHPFDLNIPQVPVGEGESKDTQSDWTTEETRLGLDVGVAVAGGVSMKMEFDRKGTTEKVRTRHAYMRTNEWLVGKNWSAFNSLPYLPLAVDGHSTGAAVGPRPDQIKFLNEVGDLRYELALEDFQPGIDTPDGIEIAPRNELPNLAGNISYLRPWGLLRAAGMLVPNRVRLDDGETEDDFGYAWQVGTKLNLNASNIVMAHVLGTEGAVTYTADFGIDGFDMVYDPVSDSLENIVLYGGSIAFEHHWSPSVLTTIGGSYMDISNKSFDVDTAFDDGFKGLVNVFFKPGGRLDGLVVGTELEVAGRTNKDGDSGQTLRFEFLMYYDF